MFGKQHWHTRDNVGDAHEVGCAGRGRSPALWRPRGVGSGEGVYIYTYVCNLHTCIFIQTRFALLRGRNQRNTVNQWSCHWKEKDGCNRTASPQNLKNYSVISVPFFQLKKQLIHIMGYYSTIMKIRATTGLTLKCKWEVKAARLRRLQNHIHVFFCKGGNVGAENSLIPRGQKGEERRQLTTEEWGASWGVKVLVAQSRPTLVHGPQPPGPSVHGPQPPGPSVHGLQPQAPPSMGFSRQEHWSGLPCPSPGVFPTQGSNQGLQHRRQILYHLSHLGCGLF